MLKLHWMKFDCNPAGPFAIVWHNAFFTVQITILKGLPRTPGGSMPDPVASVAAGPQWIDLAITSGATLIASIGAAWLTAWMQFRGVKSESAKRRIGYVRRASTELTEYRDRLDSYHADLFDDLKNGAPTLMYIIGT